LAEPPIGACDETATAVRAAHGDELALDRAISGTSNVRLAGIEIPELPQVPAARASLQSPDATTSLAELVEGRALCLMLFDRRRDRYGRLLAQVYRDDGLWIQGELLRRGLARVQVTPDTRPLAFELLRIERQAREAGEGLWRYARYRVRSPSEAGRFLGSFQVVEGKVLDATRRQDRWYLNFGEDWRSDFTVTIPAQALPDFTSIGLQPFALKGRVIRVRGWVESLNGPMIEAIVPEQIEIVDGPAK
jgi:endonuclease YncB( thermonuclease family)